MCFLNKDAETLTDVGGHTVKFTFHISYRSANTPAITLQKGKEPAMLVTHSLQDKFGSFSSVSSTWCQKRFSVSWDRYNYCLVWLLNKMPLDRQSSKSERPCQVISAYFKKSYMSTDQVMHVLLQSKTKHFSLWIQKSDQTFNYLLHFQWLLVAKLLFTWHCFYLEPLQKLYIHTIYPALLII